MDSEIKEGQAGPAPTPGVKRRMRRERTRLVAGELMQDFAQNTTLQGLRYIAEKGLSLIEKTFWAVSFVISLILCTMLIWNVWVKWQSAPIIVTVDDDLVSIQEVPFPSVTICPHTKLKKSVCDDHHYRLMELKYYSDVNDTDDVLLYEAVGLILGIPNDIKYKKFNFGIIKKIIEVSPTVDDILHSCNLYGATGNCAELFKPVLTIEGVCFTMNSLAANEILRNDSIQNNYTYLHTSQQSVGWSHSGGYSHFNSSVDVYPRRGRRGTYNRPDASIILRHEDEAISNVYNSNNDGFKVYLHHPADLPQSSVFFYSAPNEQRISLGLKLSIVNTSSSLRSYSPDTRRCYFPGERQLRYFHTYTESNCKLECLSNYTLEQCNCVWFHMPHNETSNICRINYGNMFCFQRAISQYDEWEADYNRGGKCQCYPLCLNIQYEADFVKILKYDSSQVPYSSMENNTDFSEDKFTRIELFYKATKIVPMRRSELFGLTDFMANCGGLLGLFLGFSFLSIVEIIYFCTLRLCCSLRQNAQQAENTTEKHEEQYPVTTAPPSISPSVTEKLCGSLRRNAQQAENTIEKHEEQFPLTTAPLYIRSPSVTEKLCGSLHRNAQQAENTIEKHEEQFPLTTASLYISSPSGDSLRQITEQAKEEITTKKDKELQKKIIDMVDRP